jgi:hypothetical protein
MIGFESTPLRMANRVTLEQDGCGRIEDAVREIWRWTWTFIKW